MRVNGVMIRNMGKEKRHGVITLAMREIFIKDINMELGNMLGQTDPLIRDNFTRTRCKVLEHLCSKIKTNMKVNGMTT